SGGSPSFNPGPSPIWSSPAASQWRNQRMADGPVKTSKAVGSGQSSVGRPDNDSETPAHCHDPLRGCPPTAHCLDAVLECFLFVSPEPVTPSLVAAVLEIDERAARDALESLRERYPSRGLQVIRLAGGYQLCTRPEH